MTGPWDRRGGDRRDFFRDLFGDWVGRLVEKAESRVIQQRYFRQRPRRPEVGFLGACTRCGACGEACPPHAIQFAAPGAGLAAGTPFYDPRLQPCIACTDMPCARACPTDALTVPADGWAGVHLGVLELLPDRCITFHGSECSVCAKACPVGPAALTMDEAGHPVIRAEGCVGCGVCVRACVTSPSSFKLRPLGT
jgi:MauM/NapG family ferredoxin protein